MKAELVLDAVNEDDEIDFTFSYDPEEDCVVFSASDADDEYLIVREDMRRVVAFLQFCMSGHLNPDWPEDY